MLSDAQFIRYQRQLALPEIGENGQQSLLDSRVLVIGCGGLGSAAVLYLASVGIGQLVIVDDDRVESSNLPRQVIYRERQIGQTKVDAMAEQIKAINLDCRVRAISKRLIGTQLELEVLNADVVLDCTDNIHSRQQINQLCRKLIKPLISGSAIGWKGQVIAFDQLPLSPCYHCLVPDSELPAAQRCNEFGILGPVVGIIGTLQALQAIMILTRQTMRNANQLTLFDAHLFQFQTLNVVKDPQCEVCGYPQADQIKGEATCQI